MLPSVGKCCNHITYHRPSTGDFQHSNILASFCTVQRRTQITTIRRRCRWYKLCLCFARSPFCPVAYAVCLHPQLPRVPVSMLQTLHALSTTCNSYITQLSCIGSGRALPTYNYIYLHLPIYMYTQLCLPAGAVKVHRSTALLGPP